MSLLKQLKDLIINYEYLRTESPHSRKSNNPIIKEKMIRLECTLKEAAKNKNLKVKAHLGSGNLPKRPVIYLRNQELSNSGTEGYYITLIINSSAKDGSYEIALTQGKNKYQKELGNKEANKKLKENSVAIATIYKSEISSIGFNSCLTDSSIAPHRVFIKKFSTSSLQSDKQFINELNKALSIYTALAEDIALEKQKYALASTYQENESRREFSAILKRVGQQKFKRLLLEKYNNKCVITGCDIKEVLEAAHIQPVKDNGNMCVSNGLLLRADIHTLFDLNLVNIDEEGKVHWHSSLHGSDYAKQYKTISVSKLDKPVNKKLNKRFIQFHQQNLTQET